MMLSENDLEQFGRAVWPLPGARTGTAVNQAKFGLSRILPAMSTFTSPNIRVLEVGAGCMLLAAYLASKGFQVTALEPLAPDFSWFAPLQDEVLSYCKIHGIAIELVDCLAEKYISPNEFDFIFCIHVLEHMKDPILSMNNMYDSLKSFGKLLIVCPNYDIPFEPHLGIFLVTRSKSINEKIYRRAITTKKDVWDSLSFVRYSTLRRYLAGTGRKFWFNREMLRDSFLRLGKDELFFARMPLPIRWAYHVVKVTGLIRALPLIPVRIQTPMELLVMK